VASICLAGASPYVSTIHGYFLADDFGMIRFSALHTPTLVRSFTSNWLGATYGFVEDELKPTMEYLYQLDARMYGNNPVGYHVTNIIIHALAVATVFFMSREVARLGTIASAFAALLFAYLPVAA
jgi:hypothetical protein